MKKGALVLFVLIAINSIGQDFPVVEGTLLSSDKIVLPEVCKGKYTLIGMAYSQKAEDDLITWYTPSIDKFILKTGMFDGDYDVNIYFVPLFTGISKLTFDQAFDKMKETTDERLFPHVVFYKGEIKTYKDELGLDKNEPSFFFISPEGKIIKQFDGAFSEAYFETITAIIDAG